MLAGRLRDRITILKRKSTSGAYGSSEIWEPTHTRWGRFAPMKVNSRAAYMQALNTDVTHHVTFRHNVDLSPADNRLRWKGKDYEILEPSMDKDAVGGTVTHVIVRLLQDG